MRPHIDRILALFFDSGSQFIQFFSCFRQFFFSFLSHFLLVLQRSPQLLSFQSDSMQLFLQIFHSLFLSAELTPSLPKLFSQLLALSPHCFVFLSQSLVFLCDEAHRIINSHQFVIFLLNKFASRKLLFLFRGLLLLEAQFGQTNLIGYSLLHAQNQILVLPCLVFRLTDRSPCLLARPLSLELQTYLLSVGCRLSHLNQLHPRPCTRLPSLDALVQSFFLTREVLHKEFFPLPHLIQFSTVGRLNL